MKAVKKRAVQKGTAGATPNTKANAAQRVIVAPDKALSHRLLKQAAFYSDPTSLVLNMDVFDALALLAKAGVHANCIVTSPPFYGQRDYGFSSLRGPLKSALAALGSGLPHR